MASELDDDERRRHLAGFGLLARRSVGSIRRWGPRRAFAGTSLLLAAIGAVAVLWRPLERVLSGAFGLVVVTGVGGVLALAAVSGEAREARVVSQLALTELVLLVVVVRFFYIR